ncbi:MAG: PilZ domain-containing protein [Candidatus Hydrogenedentes bacterium]|nr:PilZ domain-containing protein [Candidatus Hydrogenedentota bacterium]
MARYDVNVAWDDPFDRPAERRESRRFEFRMKLSIRVDVPGREHRLIGPGIVQDISLSGVCLVTKHDLTPGQQVTVALPTNVCRDGLCLPEAFLGPAEVVWVTPAEKRCSRVALRFGAALVQNMEFVMFVEQLQSMAAVLGA